ncbi:acetyltransferase [Polynucleobacter asymbioticus]|uniref:Transferase hexapeptide repeat containing protein n=1 Tax=Polynucleobacter asymbioticus (strain DSM 18221 / CIP 109841 / QLW-P1DMWA-1) TaxID=312153 RepID=A4SVM1_POLAQ|nr:acetyltransferase [Polynucleobacter asymbioticus]ABP33535.1 transferase hexapeptide repeat containing protein [Polynucleobacter asymbioticus QLW-P1DMWA-1]
MQGKASPNSEHHLRPLVILGAGVHAVSVANVALSAGYEIECFVDRNKKGSNLLGYSIIDKLDELNILDGFSFAIAVGDNALRERIYKELLSEASDLHFPSLVHSSAVISFFAEIGEGVVVMPKAVIGPNSKVGRFCLINTQASIDHDCVMLDYSSIAPAVSTGGGVTIGLRSAVSIGATIKHGVKIGDDCVVGASSYLNKDLASNQVAYGIPAKPVRMRSIGDEYLK